MLEKPEPCVFCREYADPASFRMVLPTWPHRDRIIIKNEGAMIVPGLGPIVSNTPYLLAIPRTCCKSFLSCPRADKESLFDALDSVISDQILFPGSKAIIFEHGGNNHNPGCKCIDHCHLHLMNMCGPWIRVLSEFTKLYHCQNRVIDKDSPHNDSPYLLCGVYIANERKIRCMFAEIQGCRQPQFFRALIGKITDNPFDYRAQMNIETMIESYVAARRNSTWS